MVVYFNGTAYELDGAPQEALSKLGSMFEEYLGKLKVLDECASPQERIELRVEPETERVTSALDEIYFRMSLAEGAKVA